MNPVVTSNPIDASRRTAAKYIIAGFGLPGRAIASVLDLRQVPYSVIEVNPAVVERCARSGLNILQGDARDPNILRRAGIETATDLALMIPSDAVVLECIKISRFIRSDLRILARSTFTSSGMEMSKLGADFVIVAEQIIATEAQSQVSMRLG